MLSENFFIDYLSVFIWIGFRSIVLLVPSYICLHTVTSYSKCAVNCALRTAPCVLTTLKLRIHGICVTHFGQLCTVFIKNYPCVNSVNGIHRFFLLPVFPDFTERQTFNFSTLCVICGC